jgi:hypothetical protein
MRLFKKRKRSIEDRLQDNPNEMIVTQNYLAVWLDEFGGMILVPGDYRSLTADECHEVLENHIRSIVDKVKMERP